MLYNIYTTDGDLPIGITDWEHLRVMRLDYTERQLFNHRYISHDPSHNCLFKARDINSKLQNIGIFSSRPVGSILVSVLYHWRPRKEGTPMGDPFANVPV